MTTSDTTRNRWKSNLRPSAKSFCRSDATVATQYINCSQSYVAAGVQQSPGNKMHNYGSSCNQSSYGNALCKSDIMESFNEDHLDALGEAKANLIKVLLEENMNLKQEVKSLKASTCNL